MSQVHPCGALPVTSIATSVWYCHHHQAFWIRIELWQQASDDVDVILTRSSSFGPFDDIVDVLQSVGDHIADCATAPGVPWSHPSLVAAPGALSRSRGASTPASACDGDCG